MMSNVIPLNAWRGRLDVGEKGIKRNLTNLVLHLQNMDGLGRELRFNELASQPEWRGEPLTDEHVVDIRLLIEREGFQPTTTDVRPAILRVCHEHAYNPVTDYLTSLVWDGRPRCDKWLRAIMGAPDTLFVSTVAAKVLIGAVARAFEPGCQVDTMLVLEGDQGLKKSSIIKALFGEPYTFEQVSGFDDHRKLVHSVMGAWAVELAEFVSVTRSAAGTVKGLITIRRDRVMLPYGRALSDLPRRFIFIGTINPGASGYLSDDTGNRRYWPVTVTKGNVAALVEARDQLWAEAVHRYRAGERWWLEGDENAMAKHETEQREESDPWEDVLRDKLDTMSEVTATEALSLLGFGHDRKDKPAQMRVAACLGRLGFERRNARPIGGGKPRWAWRRVSPP